MKSVMWLNYLIVGAVALSWPMASQASESGSSATALPSYIVKNERELKGLQKKIAAADPKSEEATWLKWQLALNAPLIGQTDLARATLIGLLKSKQTLIGADQLHLTLGRVYFQRSQFSKALSEYEALPKTSEYWFEALEEMAWAYVRINKPDAAISKLATLMSPIFQSWVGPETFFLANYNNLKICDYNSIFKNDELFKSRHGQRLSDLKALATTGANSVSAAAIDRLQGTDMNFMTFAKEANSLPRFFWRDEFLRRYSTQAREAKAELAKGANDSAKARLEQARGGMATRLQALAKAELSEYSEVIQKLNIIEAEVIQRLYMDESLKGERSSLPQADKSSNVLTFPQNDELWLDEVDSYQAKVKTCPQLKEAKL